MRAFWITLVPMFAAAALVLWGGERMARRTIEERVPVDRDRVFDFTAALRVELDRLDALYGWHLTDIASYAPYLERRELETRCGNLVGVRMFHAFKSGKKQFEVAGKRPPPGEGVRPPDVIAEGEGGALIPRNAVVLPKELLQGSAPSGWLAGPDGRHRVHWRRLGKEEVVAFAIDDRELHTRIGEHLAEWRELPLLPLQEAGERVAILGPGGGGWETAPAAEDAGPAAMVLPHRTRLGEWQVLAWDQLQHRGAHDTATLAMAGGIAGLLMLAGIFLHIQQGRALKLAEERVSFVNRVSHELGTPLTNILLNLDLAQRMLDSRPAESKRRLGLMGEEVQRLGRLVANVLTFSRGERKTLKFTPHPCVPDEAIGGVLGQFQPSLDRRKIRVEWRRGADGSALLDADALAQIVGNLVSNVEKYAASGGWLGLESRLDGECLRVTVADRGPGIPARHRRRVFEAFERVHHGVNEGASGTGLGLSIARDLARRMGGELTLTSSAGGSVFELKLPAPPYLAVVREGESAA